MLQVKVEQYSNFIVGIKFFILTSDYYYYYY